MTTTISVSPDALGMRLRMLDDMLSAERSFRSQAEAKSRALVGVMTEIAYRFAGEKLEQLRQKDPLVPQNWGPEDWRAFFLSVQVAEGEGGGWGKAGTGQQAEIAKLQAKTIALEREIQRLRQAQTTEQVEQKKSLALPREAATPEEKVSLPDPTPYGALLPELVALQELPTPPALYADRFKADGMQSKRDAALNLRRRALALRCVAAGLSVSMEISHLVGGLTGADPRSGGIRRVWDALEKQRLIIKQTLGMTYRNNAQTRLVVMRLSDDGKHLARSWGWDVVESDWEKLVRLHEGDKQEAHTLSILLFAASARLRGWKTTILPDVTGAAVPDLRIEKGSAGYYVEVETGTREHEQNAKWRMNAELNAGRVALVARNTDERKQLMEDCRHVAEHGVAGDIETLISERFSDSLANSLWSEEW